MPQFDTPPTTKHGGLVHPPPIMISCTDATTNPLADGSTHEPARSSSSGSDNLLMATGNLRTSMVRTRSGKNQHEKLESSSMSHTTLSLSRSASNAHSHDHCLTPSPSQGRGNSQGRNALGANGRPHCIRAASMRSESSVAIDLREEKEHCGSGHPSPGEARLGAVRRTQCYACADAALQHVPHTADDAISCARAA